MELKGIRGCKVLGGPGEVLVHNRSCEVVTEAKRDVACLVHSLFVCDKVYNSSGHVVRNQPFELLRAIVENIWSLEVILVSSEG